jgi:hypothetical protein
MYLFYFRFFLSFLSSFLPVRISLEEEFHKLIFSQNITRATKPKKIQMGKIFSTYIQCENINGNVKLVPGRVQGRVLLKKCFVRHETFLGQLKNYHFSRKAIPVRPRFLSPFFPGLGHTYS